MPHSLIGPSAAEQGLLNLLALLLEMPLPVTDDFS